ncbi:CerR family C-terminal domain-containing protein [Alloalcanivorax gelatiniphagus]|uniref:DUF1956 domain-containing protein n=1 Tax=Alloalcanivorax gelatiniphagus TaxID=1194167 RepID=A0ABY2XH43_9GAMM|nr:CerR family C-terminal domain-containing protein [Alloalcanivorax gelatiniphagus]TMW10978.1 DUF1956 domain-containing protein [Alloalcanivorax gelatiniphagus]|tara:strand:+ start:4921 stop:5607 length:687 start_codon:yes stop_codon:yes gene_type:complete
MAQQSAGSGQRPASEPSRSEATRKRLVDAGLRLFSRQGFDAVSTRALANAAKANQAAIPYHFQSKEGLYQAVAWRIVEMVRPAMEPAVLEVHQRHAGGVTDLVQAREDVALLVGALLDKILSQRHKYEIGYFLLREQMQPTAAMDILYDELIEPVHELLARLVGPLRGKPATDPDVIIEVQALYGEAIVFGVHRTTLIRRLGVEALDEDHLARIVRVVRETLLRQFPL